MIVAVVIAVAVLVFASIPFAICSFSGGKATFYMEGHIPSLVTTAVFGFAIYALVELVA